MDVVFPICAAQRLLVMRRMHGGRRVSRRWLQGERVCARDVACFEGSAVDAHACAHTRLSFHETVERPS